MSKSQNSQADVYTISVDSSCCPIGVRDQGTDSEWKKSCTFVFQDETLEALSPGGIAAFKHGGAILAQKLCKAAWKAEGHSPNTATVAQWHAHVSSFVSKPITSEMLANAKRERKAADTTKVVKQASKNLDKAEAMILHAYNNGNGLGQIASALQVQVSMIVAVLVKRKAKIKDQDKAIVAAVQAAEAMVK